MNGQISIAERGFVWMHEGGIKNWRKRFWVLFSNGVIKIYRDITMEQEMDHITITNATDVYRDHKVSEETDAVQVFIFFLKQPGQLECKYFTESQWNRNKWIHAIGKLIGNYVNIIEQGYVWMHEGTILNWRRRFWVLFDNEIVKIYRNHLMEDLEQNTIHLVKGSTVSEVKVHNHFAFVIYIPGKQDTSTTYLAESEWDRDKWVAAFHKLINDQLEIVSQGYVWVDEGIVKGWCQRFWVFFNNDVVKIFSDHQCLEEVSQIHIIPGTQIIQDTYRSPSATSPVQSAFIIQLPGKARVKYLTKSEMIRDKWINALTKKEVRPKQYVSVNPMYAQSSANNSGPATKIINITPPTSASKEIPANTHMPHSAITRRQDAPQTAKITTDTFGLKTITTVTNVPKNSSPATSKETKQVDASPYKYFMGNTSTNNLSVTNPITINNQKKDPELEKKCPLPSTSVGGSHLTHSSETPTPKKSPTHAAEALSGDDSDFGSVRRRSTVIHRKRRAAKTDSQIAKKRDDFTFLKFLQKDPYTFSKLMLCQEKATLNIYAMKIVEKTSETANNVEKFFWRRLNHPFLAKLIYNFESPEKYFFVSHFMQGGELFRKTFGRKNREKCARFYGAELTSALGYLHDRSILYRNLKLETVLLDDEGHVKLSDFAHAKAGMNYGDETNSMTNAVLYMPPEMFKDNNCHTVAIDWWCLGIVLYELICKCKPYDLNVDCEYTQDSDESLSDNSSSTYEDDYSSSEDEIEILIGNPGYTTPSRDKPIKLDVNGNNIDHQHSLKTNGKSEADHKVPVYCGNSMEVDTEESPADAASCLMPCNDVERKVSLTEHQQTAVHLRHDLKNHSVSAPDKNSPVKNGTNNGAVSNIVLKDNSKDNGDLNGSEVRQSCVVNCNDQTDLIGNEKKQLMKTCDHHNSEDSIVSSIKDTAVKCVAPISTNALPMDNELSTRGAQTRSNVTEYSNTIPCITFSESSSSSSTTPVNSTPNSGTPQSSDNEGIGYGIPNRVAFPTSAVGTSAAPPHVAHAHHEATNNSVAERSRIYNCILYEELSFPESLNLSKAATEILRRLLEKDPKARLGSSKSDVKDVMEMEYFKDINWKHVDEKKLLPPFKPVVDDPIDTRYYDGKYTFNTNFELTAKSERRPTF